jgi:hypothetical protein
MDPIEVRAAVTLDPEWVAELRRTWVDLMELCVWGDVKSSRLGALTKFRKRALEVGERLKSLAADRDWIPQPREQVKNALGSSFNLKDALLQLERSAKDVDGGSDLPEFNRLMTELHKLILEPLGSLENRWAALLDSQYTGTPDD